MALPSKYSISMPVEVVGSGGMLVRQVDTNGVALDDATDGYGVALPVMPVTSSGVNEDGTRGFGVWQKVTVSSEGFPVIRVDASGNAVSTAFGGVSNPLADPVIVQTSPAGTNPPEFDVTAADLLVGWYYQIDYTTNGSAPDGTADSTQQFTSDMALGATLTWGVGPFSGSSVVKWAIRYGSTNTGPWSNWSNVLTDTMPSFLPSDLFAGAEQGYAWNTTDLTKMWQLNTGATTAAFTSPVGELVDISGKGNHFLSTGNDTTRPTLQNVSNGLIQFDGSNDRLRLGSARLYSAGAMTFMFAARVSAVAANFLFSEGRDAGGSLYSPYTRQLGTAGEDNYCQITDDSSSSWVSNTVNTNAFDNTLRIFTVIDSGTVITIYVNGVSIGSVTYSRAARTVTLNNTFLGCWGPNNTPESFLTGYTGCGCGIGRVLTGGHTTAGSELNKLYNWIAGKHGLATI